MPWKLQKDSSFKCVVWFADGNTRTFYSLDWTHQHSKNYDRELGLKRLRALIHKWGALATVAIIYNKEDQQELERYNQGIKQNN
jgi:hypothetical protein